jgi:hypothetical protein
MPNYGYTNEAGEPIMDGAAYRFEQQLDEESAFYGSDDYDPADYDSPDEIDEDEPEGDDLSDNDEFPMYVECNEGYEDYEPSPYDGTYSEE